MLDIVFCALPYSNLDHINSAPAILKGVVVSCGYTSKTVDFGCELFKLCNHDQDKFQRVQQYFISNHADSTETQNIIDQFYKVVGQWFKNNPSKYIGICVFSRYTHKASLEVLELLKKKNITGKVIVGGRGLPIASSKIIKNSLSGLESHLSFAQLLEKRKLVDHVVIGDGEDAVLAIIDNQTFESDQTSDQFRVPVPNYDDYDFNDYFFKDSEIAWPVTGSKGCVRDCDFCDVRSHFGRYRYRSGADIANEMIALSKKYNAKKFQFTDSLVNGGLKPFKEFLEVLSDYNLKNPNNKIKWNGQYICRPSNQVDNEIYKLIATSGGEGLTIGAESGSNHVLLAMNKKTDVEALFSELEQFKKHNITCILLTMVGHWSETWNDFLDHCKMIVGLLPYVRSGTISGISSHSVMAILDQSPSYANREKTEVITSVDDPAMIWFCKNNPSNTFKERVFRKLIADRLAGYLQIPLLLELESSTDILTTMENKIDLINGFFQSFATENTISQAQQAYQNFDLFAQDQILKTVKPELNLELESNEYNGKPLLKIIFNDIVLFDGQLNQGALSFKFDLTIQEKNYLLLKMYGKNESTDTLVVKENIVKDKNVLLKKIILDDVDILSDYEFFRDHFVYNIDNVIADAAMPGFWKNNSKMLLEFDGVFKSWYHTKTKKNSRVATPLTYHSNHNEDYVKNLESKIVNLATQLNQ